LSGIGLQHLIKIRHLAGKLRVVAVEYYRGNTWGTAQPEKKEIFVTMTFC